MERLDGVLLTIADRSDVHAAVWSEAGELVEDNGPTHVLTQSLLDVLEVALTACRRVPGFSANANDWQSYATYVARSSAVSRQQIEAQREWWPELARFVSTVRAS